MKISSFSIQEKLILFILVFVQFAHIVDFMLPMPLGPQLGRAFNLSAAEFGILVSSYTLSSSMAGIAFALFVDQFNRKQVLIFFLSGFIFSTFCCGLSESYSALLISRCLAGVFGGGLNAVAFVVIGDLFAPEKRGAATGMLMSSFSIASVIGVPFSLWISNFGGWHVPFLMLASFAVIVWPLVVFKFPSMSGHLSDGKQKRKITPAWGIFARVLNSLPQRLGILFMMLMMFGHFMIIPYLSQSLVANTGLAESQLPLVYLVGGVLSFFTSPMIGRWADRSGKVRIFTVIHLMALVWILIITNLPILPVYLTLGISGIFFILVTGRFVPAMAVINGLVEAKHRASYFSLLASCHQLAGSLATFISGHIVYFHLENKRLENYGIAGMISCLFGLMALHIMHKVATAQK